jgi:hypothetical protein
MDNPDFITDSFGVSNYDYLVRWLRPRHPKASDANIDLWARAYLRNNRRVVDEAVGEGRKAEASAINQQIARRRLEREVGDMLRDRGQL